MQPAQNQKIPQIANGGSIVSSQSAVGAGTQGRWDWIVHAYAAFAVSIAVPMYGRLQQRTPYLGALEAVSLYTFVFLLSCVLPATILLLIAACRRINQRLGLMALNGLIGTSAMVTVLGIFSHRSFDGGFGWLILLGSIASGCLIANRYHQWSWLRSMMTVAAFAALLAPLSLILVYNKASARPVVAEKLVAGNPVPIVMVVFDCFSGTSLMDERRQIDRDRYPNFAKLADSTTWYRNCSTVHPRTNRALPAILSGRLSALSERPPNLFTLLNATERYQLTSFEPFTTECPPDPTRDREMPNPWTQWIAVLHTVGAVFLHDLVPPDLPIETPLVPRTWFGLDHTTGADRNQLQGLIRYSWDIRRDTQFEHFMDCLSPSSTPNIWFGHFALPHFPWDYLPSGNRYHDDIGLRQEWGMEGPLQERWTDDERIVRQAQQQHLLQTSYTDLLLGRLIDRMRSLDLYDRCLLIVTADHGVSFRPGLSGREPTDKSLAEIMNVPLFIKLPGQQRSDTVDLNVETTDILPTILDAIQLKPPTPLPGQSVISDFHERPQKFFYDDNRTFEVDASFDGRYEVLAEQLAMFGTGKDPLRIFKIGPHPELLGRKLSELNLSTKSAIEIHPINFAANVDYDPKNIVPAHPEAKIVTQSGTLPLQFAISINNTIWGTTQTCRAKYLQNYWRCMLPESSFQPGVNQVRVFEIDEADTELKLRECTVGPQAPAPDLPIE